MHLETDSKSIPNATDTTNSEEDVSFFVKVFKSIDLLSLDLRDLAEGNNHSKEARQKSSLLGSFLTLCSLFFLAYYLHETIRTLDNSNTIETTILDASTERFEFQVECMNAHGCIFYVKYGRDVEEELAQSTKYRIRTRARNDGDEDIDESFEDILPEHYQDGDATEEVPFKSKCIFLNKADSLIMDNFILTTDPSQSMIEGYVDTGNPNVYFGFSIPPEKSSNGDAIMLASLAHRMKLARVIDTTATGEAPPIRDLWSNGFMNLIFPETIDYNCQDHFHLIENDLNFTASIKKTELYFTSTYISTTISYNSPILAVVGQVGGAFDIIVYALTMIMFLYWFCNGGLSRFKNSKAVVNEDCHQHYENRSENKRRGSTEVY